MGGSSFSDVIGDRDAVPAMAAHARSAVVTWDERPSPSALLDELVPWWRPVVATLGVVVDGGLAPGPVRVGRDAAGRPLLVEPAGGGPALVAAHPEDVDELEVGFSADGAFWTVGVAGPDGAQRESHAVIRVGDDVRMWACTTAGGVVMAMVLDAAPGDLTVAVVRAADPDAEPDPDRPVDVVLRITGGQAVPVDRHVTGKDVEAAMEALMQELVAAGTSSWMDAEGTVDAGAWLAAFESAHRQARGELSARATAVAEAWATAPPPPSVVVVRLSPVGAGAGSDWTIHPRTRTKDVVRRRLLRSTVVDVRGRVSAVPVTPWTRSAAGDEPWRTLRGLMDLPPSPDDRPGRGTDPTTARVARAATAFAELELDAVGAINRATASAGRETVAIVVAPDGRPAPDVDRWWPTDVRPEERRRLT